ncbi:hypothetical protein AAG906_004485 [Vitis piasezkii]
MVDAETRYSQVEQTTLALKSSLSDRTYKPIALSHLAQVGPIRTNVEMGNQVK